MHSLDAFRNNKSLVTVRLVAETMNLTTRQFYSQWVNYHWVKVVYDGIEKYISVKDFTKLLYLKEITYSAAEGGRLLTGYRHTLNNLRAIGEIKPFASADIGSPKSYRYLKKDIETLLQISAQ